jgi:UDP-glucose pyrophosphorylase
MDVRKVVIPVAGWGTRSLPATKNIPKEMLPIFKKPVVQYVVEEAQASGIDTSCWSPARTRPSSKTTSTTT